MTDARRTATIALGMLLAAGAQAQDIGAPGTDPPSTVARLRALDGAVSLQPAGSGQWTTATINTPLSVGDQLRADDGARAEVEMDRAVLRLGAQARLTLLQVDADSARWGLSGGTVELSVRDGAPPIEIDSPTAAVALAQAGHYRVTVAAKATTVVSRAGAAQVLPGDGQPMTLEAGHTGVFDGAGGAEYPQIANADALDRWSDARDDAFEAATTPYVSDEVIGYADLADYGQWQEEPGYGAVWYPQVAADWAPYRYGHWLWVAPWGWTWVDDAPWGFAPSHYGRWVFVGQHWGWVPAPRDRPPVYAPALVAWIAGRAGNDAIVGWLPLAPGEVYVPAYRSSLAYVQQLNASNMLVSNPHYVQSVYENHTVQTRYANRVAPHAMALVPQTAFTTAQPVEHHLLTPSTHADLTPVGRAPAIAPIRASVRGTAKPRNPNEAP